MKGGHKLTETGQKSLPPPVGEENLSIRIHSKVSQSRGRAEEPGHAQESRSRNSWKNCKEEIFPCGVSLSPRAGKGRGAHLLPLPKLVQNVQRTPLIFVCFPTLYSSIPPVTLNAGFEFPDLMRCLIKVISCWEIAKATA